MSTDLYTNSFADNFRLARSKTLNAVSDDTYNIIRIPKFAFVTDVWLLITTAYVGGVPSITVGWIGNGETAQAAGFLSNEIAKPTVAGLKRAQHDTLVSFEGKYFSGGTGTITVTVAAGGATTEGVFQVFATYSVIM